MIRNMTLATCLAVVFLGILCTNMKVEAIEAREILETGGWMKYEVAISPILEGEVTPIWIKFEFISIEGTNATVRVTMHLSDGDEMTDVTTIDVVSGSNTGLIIPPYSNIGDPVTISGYEQISIAGESTLIYTGVNRTTVFARYSNATDALTCFWDKQTGILLEQNVIKDESTTLWTIIDTNIWQTRRNDTPLLQNVFYLLVIAGVVLASVIFLGLRKKKPRRRK